ncbi:BRO1 domain-containing protein BROX homolog isoform X1 [Vigna radiata var. radiata]|uniref:BRO1 domain-containing protein BROX homolog isoform X1 n=2 Tax=Vigna radiata var. radiata TaxID=3916 RepID=A0A3Q0EWJ7_VIGRR|nr:BRO1 domain-containing protein BROX homolog isoform X1 [Vigna radiata var. radiata]
MMFLHSQPTSAELNSSTFMLLKNDALLERMGCTYSVYRKKKTNFPEVVVFVPSTRIPVHSDLQRVLKGVIPRDLADKLTSLRNQIVLVAEDTGGSAITELRRALNEYLSLLIGLTKKEYGLEGLIDFKWKHLEDGKQDSSVANTWFEVLSAVHLMAMLTLSEADSMMIPKNSSGSGFRVVSSDSKREAIDLLLKASGYLEFCLRDILTRIPPEIRNTFPHDLQEGVLEAIAIQTLGQGTEIQLGLAVECQKATLSVKRRLACEQLIYFSQAYHCLLGCDTNQGSGRKHLRFIKWKFLEAKAAAYYYHGLILDKGNEPNSSIGAVSCFLAAEELLAESKKASLSFCLAAPVTRVPPLWGAMKFLHQKIPEVASRKSQMYGYLWEQEKGLQSLPDLPEFQLSLRPDDYELPEIDPAWDSRNWESLGQPLKEHLIDSDENPTD